MSPGTREAIMTALCDRVFAIADFRTTGRRVLAWERVADQPAAFVRNVGEAHERKGQALKLVLLRAEIIIYSNGGRDPDEAPGSYLNDLLDAVEEAFDPDDSVRGTLTLGGLVADCRIEGEVEMAPGDVGDQAIAIVPVTIVVPQVLPVR